jgi:hypothetical protein
VRQLTSKSLAAGLSAGVVLLWWPLLFGTDTVGSWLARGVTWTVCYELLVHALAPFEAALWATSGGERLRRRLKSGLSISAGRRMRGAGAVAAVAIATPATLLAVGLHEGGAKAPTSDRTKVVRVTRVVRPVTVKRVVRRVEAPAPAAEAAPAPVDAAPETVSLAPRTTEKPRPTRTAAKAPRRRSQRRPQPKPRPAPDTVHVAPEQSPACEGDACTTEPVPASGSAVPVSNLTASADSSLLG